MNNGPKIDRDRSLGKLFPDVAAELNPICGICPFELSAFSSKVAPWKCRYDERHKWDAKVRNRTGQKNRCPYCVGRKVLPEDSFAGVYPDLVKQVSPSCTLDLFQTTPKSHRLVPWICPVDNRHLWDATLVGRACGSGCPYCSNNKCLPEDSLAARFPKIAAQLDPSCGIDPYTVPVFSHKKLPWICDTDNTHKWPTIVQNRTQRDSGCPLCGCKSKMQKYIREFLMELGCVEFKQEVNLGCINPMTNYPLPYDFNVTKYKDISIRAVIEPDGEQHFKPIPYWGGEEGFRKLQYRDRLKDYFCVENDISVIRISFSVKDRNKHIIEFLEKVSRGEYVFKLVGDEY